MKRVLVFQHMDHDTVGRFADYFAEDGYLPQAVRLWEGQPIPSLKEFDFLFVLGGAQDVWQTDEYPWLVAEKEAIREWVLNLARPYIGICLGHQLLADSLGGKVGPSETSEVGVHRVRFSDGPDSHHFAHGLTGEHWVMQWHHAEVKEAPLQARVLASSPRANVQAIAIDRHALGLQFHAEFTPQTIASWESQPSYLAALERSLGQDGYARLVREALPLMPAMGAMTRRIYDNFMGNVK